MMVITDRAKINEKTKNYTSEYFRKNFGFDIFEPNIMKKNCKLQIINYI